MCGLESIYFFFQTKHLLCSVEWAVKMVNGNEPEITALKTGHVKLTCMFYNGLSSYVSLNEYAWTSIM